MELSDITLKLGHMLSRLSPLSSVSTIVRMCVRVYKLNNELIILFFFWTACFSHLLYEGGSYELFSVYSSSKMRSTGMLIYVSCHLWNSFSIPLYPMKNDWNCWHEILIYRVTVRIQGQNDNKLLFRSERLHIHYDSLKLPDRQFHLSPCLPDPYQRHGRYLTN